MSKINSVIFRFAVLLFLTMVFFRAEAQQNNTLYFMDGIPQSNQLNPAIQPKCGFYFALPVISSLEINAGNTAVGFNDVFLYKSSTDSLYYKPMQSDKDRSDFLGKLKKNNYIFSDVRLDWLSFGFRLNENYISFSAADRMEVRGNLPYDLIDFGLNLNQSTAVSKAFNFDGLGLNAVWFREYALGISREINERITFGIRGKLLFGKANISSKSSDLAFPQTGMDVWKTSAVIDIRTSIPNLTVGYDKDGKVSLDSIKLASIHGWKGARPFVMNRRNVGVALDMGIILKPEEMLQLSASIVDLGFIQWNNNLNNFSTGGNYDFKGLPVVLSDTSSMGQALVDSLKKIYSIEANHESYMTSLSGKLYLGAHLQLIKSVGVGFLTRLQLLDKAIRPQYTFSVNYSPGQSFSTALSYTIADGVYDNLGFGISFKAGPFHWYLMSDRIPIYYNKAKAGYPIPAYAKNVNFRMGFNLMFGSIRHRNIYKDKPLVEIED
jgi:hypothetical protein